VSLWVVQPLLLGGGGGACMLSSGGGLVGWLVECSFAKPKEKHATFGGTHFQRRERRGPSQYLFWGKALG